MFGGDSAGSSGQGTPRREGEAASTRNGEGSGEAFPGRQSTRRGNRLEDLEDLMMMEAIRLSLAAEEERKKKDDRDAAKEAKKEGKKKVKEAKKVAKAQRSIERGFHPIDIDGMDESGATSSSAAGKGKAVDRSGGSADFNPTSEPTSTINTAVKDDPQKHLEESRAHIQQGASGSSSNLAPSDALSSDQPHRAVLRNLSDTSSPASSIAESYQDSTRHGSQNLAPGSSVEPSPNASNLNMGQEETPPGGTPSTEPMFNFQSLTETITHEEKKDNNNNAQHIENVEDEKSSAGADTAASSAVPVPELAGEAAQHAEPLAESVATIRPSGLEHESSHGSEDVIQAAPLVEPVSTSGSFEQKHAPGVGIVDGSMGREATQ